MKDDYGTPQKGKRSLTVERETNVDQIMNAVKRIYSLQKKEIFTRNDIRLELGLTSKEWEVRYTGGFQGMIDNAPPLKNPLGQNIGQFLLVLKKESIC